MVQIELEKKQIEKKHHSGVHIFSSKIKCGECGNWYGSKVWHSNSKYRRTVWQCNHKYSDKKKCTTPHLDEETIKELFIKAANKLLEEKDEIIANFESIKNVLYDTGPLEAQQAELQNEMEIVTEMIQLCINENAKVALNQAEYQKRYDGLVQKFNATKASLETVSEALTDKVTRRKTMERFLRDLKKQEQLLTDFDLLLWRSLIDYVEIKGKDEMIFIFINNTKIKS